MDVQQSEHLAALHEQAVALDRLYPSGTRVLYRVSDDPDAPTLTGTVRWPWSVVGGQPVCWLLEVTGCLAHWRIVGRAPEPPKLAADSLERKVLNWLIAQDAVEGLR